MPRQRFEIDIAKIRGIRSIRVTPIVSYHSRDRTYSPYVV